MPLDSANRPDPRLDRVFVERERNRFASRALSFLIVLNGAASIVLLAILARAPESSVDPKFADAMLFFSGGAIAALLSSFLAYINRTVSMEAPERPGLKRLLLILGLALVVGSGAAFITGMNMVGSAASERSSSHPKGPKEKPPATPPEKAPDKDPTVAPSDAASERVLLEVGGHEVSAITGTTSTLP